MNNLALGYHFGQELCKKSGFFNGLGSLKKLVKMTNSLFGVIKLESSVVLICIHLD